MFNSVTGRGLFIVCLFLLSVVFGVFPVYGQAGLTINGQVMVVSCSSYCDDYDDINFDSGQAFNGNPERPWMAANGYSRGNPEWIRMSFPKPGRLAALRITPGFGRKEFYTKYSRIKSFEVVLNDGSREVTRFYERRYDGGSFKDLLLLYPSQPVVKSVVIRILDVYPGSEMTNPVIGEIEPVFIREGNLAASPETLAGVEMIHFFKACENPLRASSFLVTDPGVSITRKYCHTNPIDTEPAVNRSKEYTMDSLKKEWWVWQDLCRHLFMDYTHHIEYSLGYFWKDAGVDRYRYDLISPGNSDVMNSYSFLLHRREVSEKVKKPAPVVKPGIPRADTGEKKEGDDMTVVTRMRTFIRSLSLIQDVYVP